jgi:hypothetical protein
MSRWIDSICPAGIPITEDGGQFGRSVCHEKAVIKAAPDVYQKSGGIVAFLLKDKARCREISASLS